MTDRPLFDPLNLEPIDPTSQVTRIPGIDAPCHCGQDECWWPWCNADDEREEG